MEYFKDIIESKLNQNDNSFFINVADKILKFTVEEITPPEIIIGEIKSVNSEDQLTNDPAEETLDSDTTIVTGLWDLGRGEIDDKFKRSYQDYLQNFAELLKTPANMYIYISKKDENFVWKHRSPHNTKVKIFELEDFKTWFPFFDKVQEIRKDPSWYNSAGWLSMSPQATLEYYNPVVMSKMFLLNDATINNPFNSKYFYWLDAGICNTVHPGYFYHDKVYSKLSKVSDHLNKFLFISYPYEFADEVHGFERKALAEYCKTDHVKYVCRGGFFGGEVSFINKVNAVYYSLLQSTLAEGLMGTEESIFAIIAYTRPDIVHNYRVDINGLLWTFFIKLKDVDAFIETLPKQPNIKTNLYVLGFNSPEQFRLLCESIKEADTELFYNTKKILVNNSIDENTFDEYDELCKWYDFEEIHKDNIGICGARQFIAEHFDKSGADFYLFFEDDMFMNSSQKMNTVCRNGFRQYVPEIYKTIMEIMSKENFDFLKLSFSEFYGDNSTQWAWYNVPQDFRSNRWPDYDTLPEMGLDPNSPKTKFDTIRVVNQTAYITGEIYYSNWPQIVSREGNTKMFLDTKWSNPYEQTWMSHIYQETLKGNIKPGLLLASPIDHTRIVHYDGSIRREN